MAYKYETPKAVMMRYLLRHADMSLLDLIVSIESGDMSEDDIKEVELCEALRRDIIRIDSNRNVGLYHKSRAENLKAVKNKSEDA